jgi:MFS family permease
VTTKLTFKQQLDSFPNAFWVANIMELIERLAYYGVRAVVGLYIVDAAVRGGLELTHPQRGLIFMIWALFQTLLPMFTGAYSDRYGYKKSLYIAFSMNTVAYVLMGLANSYIPFFAATLLLATGTAIFKPPLHGTLAHTVKDENSSVGWGMFYMLVNIGGFLGPFIAGICRVIAWKYVFFASAAVIALNFIPTIFFLKDYAVEVRQSKGDLPETGPIGTFVTGIMTLVKDTRFMVFLAIFSGFWLMFMQLFDTLPIYIDEWANTSREAAWFVENITIGGVNTVGWILVAVTLVLTAYAIFTKKKVLAIMAGLAVLIAYTLKLGITQVVESATLENVIKPEFMVNIDAGAIVFFMLVIAVITGKMKPIIAMIVGMLISTVGILACGSFQTGWLVAFAIFVFAVGEMGCSPKFSEYIGLMAPPEKKAIYMGYSNIPFAIGWTLAGALSGWLYAIYSDKFKFAKDYMVEHLNMDSGMVFGLEKLEVMPTLATALNSTELEATKVLWDVYHPWIMWWIFAGIGLVATIGMVFYHFWLERDKKKRDAAGETGAAPAAEATS